MVRHRFYERIHMKFGFRIVVKTSARGFFP